LRTKLYGMPRRGDWKEKPAGWGKQLSEAEKCILKEEFEKNRMPNSEEYARIATKIGFTQDRIYKIKNWFNNARSAETQKNRQESDGREISPAPKKSPKRKRKQPEANSLESDDEALSPRKKYHHFSEEQYEYMEENFARNPRKLLTDAELAQISSSIDCEDLQKIKDWFRNVYYGWCKGSRNKIRRMVAQYKREAMKKAMDAEPEKEQFDDLEHPDLIRSVSVSSVEVEENEEVDTLPIDHHDFKYTKSSSRDIEKIVDMKVKNGEIFLQVKWRDYPDSWNTWEDSQSLPFTNPVQKFVVSHIDQFRSAIKE
jgi:hypothetical protein